MHQIPGRITPHRETPHSIRKVARLILQSLQQKTLPKWKAVISVRQQQINEAPVNTLKNFFLEERTGRSEAKSGLGRTMPSSVVAKEFINWGN
jgi:hypothetical protein